MKQLIRRLMGAWGWRVERIRLFFYKRLLNMGGEWFVRLRWPWPMRKPWQRKRLRVFSTGGGIGDELMCLSVLHEIKARNPSCELTFVCRHPFMASGLPFIDRVESYSPPQKPRGIALEYGYVIPPPRPLITMLAECVGLVLTEPLAIMPPMDVSEEMRSLAASLPSPRIVIQPLASKWTLNKKWPTGHWIQLIKMLTAHFDVIEIGTDSELPAAELGPRFRSLVKKTNVQDLAHLISEADLFIGPPSGGMHLARVAGVPSVIVFGGYESPSGYIHPNTDLTKRVSLSTTVSCAPCWLEGQCPYGQKCLTEIQPDVVFSAACKLLDVNVSAI